MTPSPLNTAELLDIKKASVSKGPFDELTSIRGVAAWWVVLYHFRVYCEPYLPHFLMRALDHGYLAVDIFFVLSGFVIYLNYGEKFQNISRSNTLTFLTKRLARIYPLHLFMLIAYLSVPAVLMIFRSEPALPDRFSSSNFLLNLTLIHNWGWTDEMTWNFPSWSISSEWGAYLLFPPMALAIGKFAGKPTFLLILCIGSLSLLALLYFVTGETSIGHNITGLGTLRCILEFVSGAALCALYLAGRGSAFPRAGAALSLLLILMFCLGLAPDYLLIPGSIVLLLYAVIGADSFIARTLRHRLLIYLGEISYSTYMLHALVIQWMKFLVVKEGEQLQLVWILLYLAIVLVGSHILFRFVEKPSQRLINNWSRRRRWLQDADE